MTLTKVLNRIEKIFFTLVLFLLTDDFNKFISFLSIKPYVKHAVNFLTGIPIDETTKVFRILCRGISILSLDAAFWFIFIMLILRPEILVRVRKMVWHNWGIFALLMLACASWFWSISPDATLGGVWLVLKITLVGIYISQTYSIEELLDLLVWVIALGSVLSILAIWLMPEQGISNQPGITLGNWQGIYSFKNYLGRLMAFGNGMLVIYWLKNAGSLFRRILALGLFILTGVLLVFSDSATSLLSLAGMYGALILYAGWTNWGVRFSKRVQRLAVLIGITAIALIALNYKIIFALVNRSPTVTGRVDLWRTLWTWFQKHPLFGFGYNAFWQQFPKALLGWARHAHNGYIEIALGLGFSGLIIFIVSLVILWKRAFSLLSQKRQIVFFWPLLALIYLTLSNLTYSIAFENPNFHWALFVIIAGVVTPSQPVSAQNQPAAGENL